MELRTFGELTLRDAGGRVLSTRRRELTLLVYLLRRRTPAPSRAELAELLWPDREPRRARHSLRQALVHLRHLLGERVIASGDPVHVAPDAISMDIGSFEAAVAAGRWREAVEQCTAEFLKDADDLGNDGFRYWLESEREAVRLRLAWACEQLVAEAERGGRIHEAIGWAERWAAVLPLAEPPQIRLVEMLLAAGRGADAVASHASFVARLARELQLEPSAELAALGTALEHEARVEAVHAPARGSAAMFAPALVGRDGAVAELLAAWQAARLGRLQVVVVEGAAGSGKTRLCEQVRWKMAESGAASVLLHARATDVRAAGPWAVARVLLAPLRSARGLGGAPDNALAQLASLVPGVRDRYPRLPEPGATEAAAVVRVLCDVAAEQPLLIIVDDLDAADEPTQELLLELCRSEQDAPILLVVTARSGAADACAAVRAVRAARSARRIPLAALARKDVERLLRSMLPLDPADLSRLAQRLHAGTDGNPGRIRARVDSLVTEGRLALAEDGLWRLSRATATRGRTRELRYVAAAATVLLLMVMAGWWARAERRAPGGAVIAIGEITGRGDTDDVAAAIPDMLATSLSRIGGLSVLSNARVHELHGQLSRRSADVTLGRAALQAGAQELVEGTIYRVADGLRLDLRRIDLRTATVLDAYRVEAADPFELVDRATVAFMPSSTSVAPFADVSTPSMVAYRLYAEGLHAYYDGDASSARRLFEAAIAEDSAFAMATYYLALTLETQGAAGSREMLARAARLARTATDRERLLVSAAWADVMEEPSALTLADTLAIRYPLEPDGHYFLGRSRLQRGDFLAAVPHLRRVIDMDSLAVAGARPHCRACDAYQQLVSAYMLADSLDRAESIARAWTRGQPGSARAWNALASTLEYRERYDEAREARRRAAPLQPGHRMVVVYPALIDIRSGDFAAADHALSAALRSGPPAVGAEARWFLAISLRYQGRLREALQLARPLRQLGEPGEGTPPYVTVLEAQILFEMGRFREAAALFDSIAAALPRQRDGAHARDRRAWVLAHVATAHHAAGDTASVAGLADEIEALGRLSAHGRDRRLHHYVRGLQHVARGERQEAVVALRRAVYSVTGGNYTRISYELGGLLLELGRPQEAVAVLRPALAGPLEAANLYLSRTELHARLGHAWQQAGQPDSAAAHYRWALRAWHAADPSFDERVDTIRGRLGSLALRGTVVAAPPGATRR